MNRLMWPAFILGFLLLCTGILIQVRTQETSGLVISLVAAGVVLGWTSFIIHLRNGGWKDIQSEIEEEAILSSTEQFQ